VNKHTTPTTGHTLPIKELKEEFSCFSYIPGRCAEWGLGRTHPIILFPSRHSLVHYELTG